MHAGKTVCAKIQSEDQVIHSSAHKQVTNADEWKQKNIKLEQKRIL